MKKLIVPDEQIICNHCKKVIDDDMAMIKDGRFYCFHDWLNVLCKDKDIFDSDWVKNTALIKEI